MDEWKGSDGQIKRIAGTYNNMTIKWIFLKLLVVVFPSYTFAQTLKSNLSTDSPSDELRMTKLSLESAVKRAEHFEYLLAAKELALRSVDIKDSIFQALAAIQAFKFNRDHDGNKHDIDIYRALLNAMKRLGDPTVKDFPPEANNKDLELAARLCGRMKRNMTVEEWNTFQSHLPYQATCGSSSRK